MKRFAFALQPVLEHRKRKEDEKQLVVAVRKRALDEAERELARLNEEFRSNTAMLRRRHKELDVREMQSFYAHLQFLDRCIVAQIRIVAERRVALDRARADLLAASREKKVVEKLKERRREAFVLEEQRIEQKELDDGNARRYGRIQLGGRP
ncbi:MAG TPA: flagellar export protein FliJ [Candidatus Acidoferrales bacterium]|nr:flagellar export protein FliJ [Candidatus Acidoferrales bacterium]